MVQEQVLGWLMSKEGFSLHLKNAVKHLTVFTRNYCFNDIAEKYIYRISASGESYHDGMDDFAKKNLDAMLRNGDKLLTEEEVVDLLYVKDKVPSWINIAIFRSDKDITVVSILATREWRTYDEAIADFPAKEIFHAQVPLPYDYKEGNRFDINWQKSKGSPIQKRVSAICRLLRNTFR